MSWCVRMALNFKYNPSILELSLKGARKMGGRQRGGVPAFLFHWGPSLSREREREPNPIVMDIAPCLVCVCVCV